MIEYYTLMHKGNDSVYRDCYFMNYGTTITVLIVFISLNESSVIDNQISTDLNGLVGQSNSISFDEIKEKISLIINEQYDYLLLTISDDSVKVDRHGSVYANIIKNGELKLLPNGPFALEDDDHVICGTASFFKPLSDLAIVADASSSLSSEEWMDSVAYRIAEQTYFSEGNITGATFIVRKDIK